MYAVKTKQAKIPLHWAAKEGHAACIKILSKEWQVVNTKDKQENTPLHLATLRGDLTLIEGLLAYNADCNHENKEKKIRSLLRFKKAIMNVLQP